MKVLQLNIWGGRLGKEVIKLLNQEDADVVCLQEAVSLSGGNGFLIESLEQIQKVTGYEYVFFSPAFGYPMMNQKAQSGLAILSKHPFLNENNIFTRLDYIDNFDITESDYNIRSLQHVQIEHEGGVLNILNHHGHHVPGHKDGDEETLRQCGVIMDYIGKLSEPVVLCGDFNLHPTSGSLELINATLVNHAKITNVETTRNRFSPKNEVCDYIFTSKGLETKDFKVLDDVVSDHQALTVEIK